MEDTSTATAVATADRPRRSGEQDKPDIMNDPEYAVNDSTAQNGYTNEKDTCRICRSEATDTEPLYHPCKCSGSIKFVHQECLMEWLSHSQKKYCELCKTPFRFTKLYDPHMPAALPAPLFLKHLVAHTFTSLVTWSRLLLVCFVWLAWLPWSMRAVWRFLFWMADGGWVSWDRTMGQIANSTSDVTSATTQLAVKATKAAPLGALSHLFQTASPVDRNQVSRALAHIPASLVAGLNTTVREPSLWRAIRKAVPKLLLSSSALTTESSLSTVPTPEAFPRTHQSFLSQISFFNSLTRSKTFNKVLIDTIEGQIITLLVVVSFILIFLIREWVVQQHPGLHAGGQNVDMLGPRPDPLPAQPQGLANAPPARPRRARAQRGHNAPRPERAVIEQPLDEEANRQARDHLRPIALPRGRTDQRLRTTETEGESSVTRTSQESANDQNPSALASPPSTPPIDSVFQFGGQQSSEFLPVQRPPLPSRESLSKVTEIQRSIEEERRPEKHPWPGVEIFKSFWTRADGNPERVLEMIAAEERTEELGWIVEAMMRLQEGDSQSLPMSLQLIVPNSAEDSASPHSSNQQIGKGPLFTLEALQSDESEYAEQSEIVKAKSSNIDSQASFEKSFEATSSIDTPMSPVSNTTYSEKGKEKDINLGVSSPASHASLRVAPPYKTETSNSIEVPGVNFLDPDSASPIPTPTTPKSEVEGSQLTTPIVDAPDSNVGEVLNEHFQPLEPEFNNVAEQATQDVETADDIPSSDDEIDGQVVEPIQPAPGRLERIAIWIWGVPNVEDDADQQAGGDDRQVIRDAGAEAPFVAVGDVRNQFQVPNQQARPRPINHLEAPEEAADPPPGVMDAQAVEDGEDFDGVMELIGMQGPIAGLVQNALFSAVVISATVGVGVWFPYIWGKFVILVAANPIPVFIGWPLRVVTTIADVTVDLALFLGGSFCYWSDWISRSSALPLRFLLSAMGADLTNLEVAQRSRLVAENALQRLGKVAGGATFDFSGYDLPIFSVLSHQALYSLESKASHLSGLFQAGMLTLYHASTNPKNWTPTLLLKILFWPYHSTSSFYAFGSTLRYASTVIVSALANPRWLTKLQQNTPISLVDPSLAHWSAGDRTLAVLAGYLYFCMLGALYLKKSAPFSSSPSGRRIEGLIGDILRQAGGVIKVILIIGIEMIVFPLYCGLLLDMALLPLFEKANFQTRLNFTLGSVWTSVFVHWFVGTCYMFHFALFVSMCRKIMRNGVLYFIRDPDDPTFHPVRDVLERSVTTQLRKITFSALVYGALVMLCLGGVVWGLCFAVDGVLPIHWSSNEPVLEFPVDLLFYNFLMPLAVKFFKPSDGLHTMYTWWFRKCAKALRLTWFLFGERQPLEEGYFPRTWKETFNEYGLTFWKPAGENPALLDLGEAPADMTTQSHTEEPLEEQLEDPVEVESSEFHYQSSQATPGSEDEEHSGYESDELVLDIHPPNFVQTGRYVRAPGSDQVRIPRGGPVFLNLRDPDGSPVEFPDQDNFFTTVHIPPNFRFRVALFVVAIWVFAAVTGVMFTVIPLMVGRKIFASIIPAPQRMNDLYAFSFGFGILGAIFYGAKQSLKLTRNYWSQHAASLALQADSAILLDRAKVLTLHGLKVFYLYSMIILAFPSLLALIIETYMLIPLHAYLAPQETHVIHLAQGWTLGVLYLNLLLRLVKIKAFGRRPSSALNNVFRDGVLKPKVGLATRAFIMPGLAVAAVTLLTPMVIAKAVLWTLGTKEIGEEQAAAICQFAYPTLAAAVGWVALGWAVIKALKRWSGRVRDELYLVGERLHNFGEKRSRRRMARA
ncbi:MAG: hypothetical protein M1814_000014 [Vezdaea aestivalis]|nr:MAG: hypothetical protein M1814_000014 [Vezdaea aestivalis]